MSEPFPLPDPPAGAPPPGELPPLAIPAEFAAAFARVAGVTTAARADPDTPAVPADAALAERARRAAVRANLLADLPPPGAARVTRPTRRGRSRPDLWPPPPELPPRAGGGANTYSQRFLIDLIRTFAESRGPDFGILEFARWSGVATRTLYLRVGDWPTCRALADLPRRPARPDARRETLHRFLEALHRNAHRETPLTGAQLAGIAGVGVSAVTAQGGIHHLRALYKLWATAPQPPAAPWRP